MAKLTSEQKERVIGALLDARREEILDVLVTADDAAQLLADAMVSVAPKRAVAANRKGHMARVAPLAEAIKDLGGNPLAAAIGARPAYRLGYTADLTPPVAGEGEV